MSTLDLNPFEPWIWPHLNPLTSGSRSKPLRSTWRSTLPDFNIVLLFGFERYLTRALHLASILPKFRQSLEGFKYACQLCKFARISKADFDAFDYASMRRNHLAETRDIHRTYRDSLMISMCVQLYPI